MRGRRLADFVHEDGAAMRLLEHAGAIAVRAGETAADVAKELGLEQRLGQRRAVDGDERRTAPHARRVDQAGDDLFAGTAFAGDENFRVATGGVVDFFLSARIAALAPTSLTGCMDTGRLYRREVPIMPVGFGTESSRQRTKCAEIALLCTNCCILIHGLKADFYVS